MKTKFTIHQLKKLIEKTKDPDTKKFYESNLRILKSKERKAKLKKCA